MYFFRGVLEHQLKNYKDAIKDYTKAIDLDPDNQLYKTNLKLADDASKSSARK